MRGAVRQVCVWWEGLWCMVTNTSFSLASAGFVRVVRSWVFMSRSSGTVCGAVAGQTSLLSTLVVEACGSAATHRRAVLF